MGFGPSNPCVLATLSLIHILITVHNENQENFQRWISRFPYRGRTQLTAISNANCRIRESSDFRTQPALWVKYLQQVCFSLTDYYKSKCDWTPVLSSNVNTTYSNPVKQSRSRDFAGSWTMDSIETLVFHDNQSWSQARLPAELKHINKRRKRNQQRFPQ